MKNSFASIRPLFVSVTAFLALTVNAVATAAVFTAAGMLAVLAVDYGRRAAPQREVAEVVAFGERAPDAESAQRAA